MSVVHAKVVAEGPSAPSTGAPGAPGGEDGHSSVRPAARPGRLPETPAKAPPGPAPDPLPGLGRVVEAILRHALDEERMDSASRGGQSPLAWVLWCIELGAIIRTTGRDEAPRHPGRAQPLPPLGLSAPVADAIAVDGQGLAEVTRTFGAREVRLALEHRIGWAMATDTQRGKWAAKIASGDSKPALEGMHEAGVAALGLLLAEWATATRAVAG